MEINDHAPAAVHPPVLFFSHCSLLFADAVDRLGGTTPPAFHPCVYPLQLA